MSKTININFASLDDFYKYVLTKEDKKAKSHSTNDPEWFGTKTFEEAVEIVKKGWKEGVDKVSASLIDRTKIRSRETDTIDIDYAISGTYVDIGRYITGEPECMVEFTSTKQIAKYARLWIDMWHNANYSKEKMFERGLKVINLIDGLERKNIRCEIIITGSLRQGGWERRENSPNLFSKILVKRAEERLNIESLVFCLCHASFTRRFAFAMLDRLPGYVKKELSIIKESGYFCEALRVTEDYIKEKEKDVKTFINFANIKDTGRDFDIVIPVGMSEIDKIYKKYVDDSK